jgi:hypothetical protein
MARGAFSATVDACAGVDGSRRPFYSQRPDWLAAAARPTLLPPALGLAVKEVSW